MQLLLKLGPEENRVRMMMTCDGCQAIIQAFTLHCENIPMTLIAFDVITLLAETSIEFRSKLGECGVCEAIVEALRLALSPFQSLLSREELGMQSMPLPLPALSPAASSVSSLGRVSVAAGGGGGQGGVHGARTISPATIPTHATSERDNIGSLEGSYQPPSELLSAQTVNVKNRTSPSSAEKKQSAHIDRETENGTQLLENLTVLQDAEMIREGIENKHDLQEIALFCAKTCWLMGRLCENCFENKTLFGECDGCDVLVQVLRLFTEVSIKEDQQIRESSMQTGI
jgi:hypothetical protein